MTDRDSPSEHRIRTTRRARYFTLSGVDAATLTPVETWVACHGFGQLAAGFARGLGVVAEAGIRVIAPEALNRFYLNGGSGSHADAAVGATWMTREDRQAEIADYVEFLDAVRDEAIPPSSPLTVLGFSQGVATATRWVAQGARGVDRLILWAGALPPDVDPAIVAARVARPLVLVSGERDQYATWMKADEQVARLRAAGVSVEVHTFDGGHRLDDATLRKIVAR